MMMGIDLLVIAAIGAVVYALGWRPQLNQQKPADKSQAPLEVVKERFARGEISADEYNQIRAVLEG